MWEVTHASYMQALAVRLGEEHEQAVAALLQQQELQQAVLEDLAAGVKADCQARIQGAPGTAELPPCITSGGYGSYSTSSVMM